MGIGIIEIARVMENGGSEDACFMCEIKPDGLTFLQVEFVTRSSFEAVQLGRLFDRANAERRVIAQKVIVTACPKHEDRLHHLAEDSRHHIGLNTIMLAMGPHEDACTVCGYVLKEDNGQRLTILIEASDGTHYLDRKGGRICNTCSDDIRMRVGIAGSRFVSQKSR